MPSMAGKLFSCLIPDSNDSHSLEVWRVTVGILLMLLVVFAAGGTWFATSERGFATKSQFDVLYERIQASDERMLRTELRKLRRDQCLAILEDNSSKMQWTRRFIEELSLEYWNVAERKWDKPRCKEIIPNAVDTNVST